MIMETSKSLGNLRRQRCGAPLCVLAIGFWLPSHWSSGAGFVGMDSSHLGSGS